MGVPYDTTLTVLTLTFSPPSIPLVTLVSPYLSLFLSPDPPVPKGCCAPQPSPP